MRPPEDLLTETINQITISYRDRLHLIQNTDLSPFKKRDLAVSFYISFAQRLIDLLTESNRTTHFTEHPFFIGFTEKACHLNELTLNCYPRCQLTDFTDVNP
jgi:hypothetical protein